MPKEQVTDPITDEEIARSRVQAYMAEHRAAVKTRLVEQKAEGLRNLSIGRDQILGRLWHLANVSHEETRGSITGQIKALSMIVAIEGLIPVHRLSGARTQPVSPAEIYLAELRRRRQAEAMEPDETVTAVESQPATPPGGRAGAPVPVGNVPPTNPDRNQTSPDNPFIYPKGVNWAFDSMGRSYDVNLNAASPLRLPILPRKGASPQGR